MKQQSRWMNKMLDDVDDAYEVDEQGQNVG
jgi:hypothetical protein